MTSAPAPSPTSCTRTTAVHRGLLQVRWIKPKRRRDWLIPRGQLMLLLGLMVGLGSPRDAAAQPELLGPRRPTSAGEVEPAASPDPVPKVASKLNVLDRSPHDLPLNQFNQLITHVVRDNIPHTFQETKEWGMTSTRWDGLDVHREGWRIKTKRKRKEVNHGDWKMYTCELIDPDREFSVEISNIRTADDGRTLFDVDVDALLKLHGRTARWVKGVQIFSIGADANARIKLQIEFSVATKIELNHLPPDVFVDLEVIDAQLDLNQFDLIRVGKLGGEPADQIGRGMQHILENKLEEKRPKLVEKLNRAIDKREDELRLSLHDAMGDRWQQWTQPKQTPDELPVPSDDKLLLNGPVKQRD